MRPKIKRKCRHLDGETAFKPTGIPGSLLEKVKLTIDEFEAVRLCDYEGKNQIEACEVMGVSRRTFQRILKSGRYKITDSLLNKKFLIILNEQEIEE